MQEASIVRQRSLHDWNQIERGMRYGFGVRHQYPGAIWDEHLEAKLRSEWSTFADGCNWEHSREHVRHGWALAAKH